MVAESLAEGHKGARRMTALELARDAGESGTERLVLAALERGALEGGKGAAGSGERGSERPARGRRL